MNRIPAEHMQPEQVREPLISVVTVTYNAEAHLEQTIQSVLGQSYGNVEYIVIDGGSTDRTLEIIGKYRERIGYFVSEPDRGIYDAMNKGIARAKGELIGLLNADDFYEPDALEKVAAAYRKEPAVAIYYGDHYQLQDDLGMRYKAYAHMKYWIGMCVCHQALFVHREVYRTLGGYDLGFRLAADYEFILRSATRGIRYLPTGAFLVNFRNTGSSSENYLLSIGEAKEAHRRYFGAFSRSRAVYLARYYKTYLIFHLQRVIKRLLGERILDRVRVWYLKLFYVK